MKERIDRCKESGGQVEQFRDRNGCEAVSCRQQGFEFENELKRKNKAFIDAIKKGIILFGQENFIKFMRGLQK